MHICGRPVRIKIAFPRPIVEPPPIETTLSADVDFMYSSASRVTWRGVCMVAWEYVPAGAIEAEVKIEASC